MKSMNEMSDGSRIWIYQANRSLSEDEVDILKQKGLEFINSWSSHGAHMDATFEIFHQRVLVIAADEEKALSSGCGIDKSVRFVKELGDALGIDFFQRTQVLYREQGDILEKPIHEFWAMRKAGIILDNTIVFDNTIKTVGDLKTIWEVPFSQSWHNEMWGR